MAKELHVEIVAVEAMVWEGEAEALFARTTEGELGVLPGHAPLLGQLADPGTVRVKRSDGEDLSYTVNGGFLSVDKYGVTVLAESCEPATAAAS